MRPRHRLLGLTVGAALALGAVDASAQVDVRLLARALRESSGGATPLLPPAFRDTGRDAMAVLVRLPNAGATPPGLLSLAPGLAAYRGSWAAVEALATAHPDWTLSWAPPRRPLIDVADDTTHAAQFRNLTGLTGKGVVVGIVDTGFDPKHPDLRNADGTTRVAWTLDFSRQPTGKHPALEAEYGCDGTDGYSCSILSGADLDQLLAEDSALLPRDTVGHGTHVASLAAGNGLSGSPPAFVGLAPEATLVAVRVTRGADGSILDPDVVLATRFVFDRAKELGMPAVANLSLGSDFGGHDGNTLLEQSLASFVGSGQAGRAIVVAAGNSGGVYTELSDAYPGPFGVHTEVHVPRASKARVPILSPPVGKSTTSGTIYVWIAGRPGDQLEVGVDDEEGEWVEPVTPGHGAAYERGGVTATVLNQKHGGDSPLASGTNGAVVTLAGTWRSGTTFAIRLQGHGTARLWVQSDGDLTPGVGSTGAVFPRASKEGTIGIPASSSALIAVGATLNRIGWTDRTETKIKLEKFGSEDAPTTDSTAYFSGAGPNALGQMKPDLVAPGAFVVGAMSALADPAVSDAGIFSGGSVCGDHSGCLVVDDHHAISSGTSMAAPIVAGAVALLFERDPSLDQNQARTLLQAGVHALDGVVALEQQAGPGELDLVGTLAVMDSPSSPISAFPSATESWMALAASYIHPDPDWPLRAVVELRAEDEGIADGFDPDRLSLDVRGGNLVQPLTRVAPGLWQFAVAAPAGSGGASVGLRLLFDGQVLVERELPVAVDRWVAADGVDARGGCATSPQRSSAAPLWLALALSIVSRRRRNRTTVPSCEPG